MKFGAQYFKRNMNHTEGDSLRMVTGPAHTTSEEHQIRAAALEQGTVAAGETRKPA